MSNTARIPRECISPEADGARSHTLSDLRHRFDWITLFLEWFGELGLFAWKVMRAAVRRPFEGRELLRQLDEIGSKSLPLVALAGAAIGAVLSLESRSSLVRFGAKSMLPPALVFSIIHETGPIVTGLVVSGRVGIPACTSDQARSMHNLGFMEPSSAPMPAPTLALTTRPVTIGPVS